MAIEQRKTKSPLDWWDAYGGRAIELQSFAKRIVGLCCSSSGCERNWSTFEFIHTKKRNSFLSGGTTTSVGRVVVEIGVHVAIWPYSGHYCDIVQQMIVLWSKLASLSNTLRGYYWCGSGRTKRRGRSWKISVLDTRFCASTFGGRVIMTFLWPSLSRTELDNDFLSTGRYLWGTIFLDPLIPRDYSLKASKMYPSCMTRWTLQEREWRLICIIGTHEGNTEFSYRINIRSQDRRYKQ
ncbi:hypothetical protein POM88_012937 [Heracleum sosnowskyi]|uniref:HAT C-terminal dimerisation domain-containing protein n=1 Tax=Heracleum sosnowskyi TaxID=360622 RepID=A0AAD8J000_9APIA|nr:hypothetical protein POM88_012937 [Heracleum sosnowskyi]